MYHFIIIIVNIIYYICIYIYVSSLHISLVSGVRYHQLVFTTWGTTLQVLQTFVLAFPTFVDDVDV